MMKIKIHRENNIIKSIETEGHCNYAEYGKDIVCSAVSILFQTIILGLRAIEMEYPNNVSIEEN